MPLEILLASISLIVAITGTLLDEPSRGMKAFLIVLASCACLGSIAKAWSDESEKRFIRTAIISTLSPSNAAFKDLMNDVHKEMSKVGFEDQDCYHADGEMVCFLYSDQDNSKHRTLVLNSSEISDMYANEIGNKPNGEFIEEVCNKTFDPQKMEEDFKDKIGILGSGVSADIYSHWPEPDYNDRIGVKFEYEEDGRKQSLVFTPEELRSLPIENSCSMFYTAEKLYRDKFKAEDVATLSGAGK